jgi:hypothetical protein
MMTVVSWIQFGALLVAILALVFQQYRVYQQQQQANQLAKSIELRTETKLRVFYIVQDEQLSLDEILHKLRDQSPLNRSGDTEEEIRKALYEMLQDETVRLLYNKKYSARLIPDRQITRSLPNPPIRPSYSTASTSPSMSRALREASRQNPR